MSSISRREFGGMVLVLGTGAKRLLGATGLDDAFRTTLQKRKIPAAVAMVATAEKTTYTGVYGKRDSVTGVDATANSIFAIASMTKAITSTAAMQLVEQGKVALDEPIGKHLPQLAKLDVLDGFDKATGKPILRPSKKQVTLRHLLTHTSGFAYDTWNDNMAKWVAQAPPVAPGTYVVTPLMFEPGTRWQYGTSVDWAGRLVEAVSGLTLEEYFQRNIFKPLGMNDTTFILPPEKFDRLVSTWQRQSDGILKENPRTQPAPPKLYNGGGGLYSTAGDYVRFMQMILRHGQGNGKQILQAKTVAMMSTNQIGDISAGKLKTTQPQRSLDGDFHPGSVDGFGLGFLINKTAYDGGGRSAGSLAWAGIDNTFYWIDPQRGICAVLMMQFLPFVDTEAAAELHDFERAVYKNLPAGV